MRISPGLRRFFGVVVADNETLTDAQLIAVAKSGDSSLLRALNGDERTRLIALSKQPDPAAELPPRTGVMGALDTVFQPIGRAIRNHPAAAGAMALSVPMTLATGGLAAPAAMGLAGLAGAGGAGAGLATSELANRDTAPLPTVASNAAAMGTQGLAAAAGEGFSRGAGALLQSGARRLMTSAVKPSLADNAPKVVQTLLDEGVNVTPGGVAKLQTILGQTNQAISRDIASAPGAVNPLQVAGRLTDTARKFSQQVNPQADLEAISQVGQNFLDHPIGGTLSLPDAQALKVGTYQRLAGKYGELSNATTEAEKALARGLKEDIATQVPGIADLNAREGGILQALDPLMRRVAIQGRSNPAGFAMVAQHPVTFLTALADKSPMVKSLLARGMWAAAGRASGIPADVLRGAVQAVAAGAGDAATSTSPESAR
jgi:hypothetical protein